MIHDVGLVPSQLALAKAAIWLQPLGLLGAADDQFTGSAQCCGLFAIAGIIKHNEV